MLDKWKATEFSKSTIKPIPRPFVEEKDCRFLLTKAGNRLVHQNSSRYSVLYHTLKELIDLQFFYQLDIFLLIVDQAVGEGTALFLVPFHLHSNMILDPDVHSIFFLFLLVVAY